MNDYDVSEIKVPGRPSNPITTNMLCPHCLNRTLRKAGFHEIYTKHYRDKAQIFRCKYCHKNTIKPIIAKYEHEVFITNDVNKQYKGE